MTIRPLPPAARDEAIAVLAAAFYDYPVMRFVLATAGDRYDADLAALIGYYCDRRFLRGWPVLGLETTSGLVAVASLNEPGGGPAPAELLAAEARLRRTIGDDAYRRMTAFEAASDGGEPVEPHYFVGMLGVDPAHQRRGYAGALLDHIREMSRRHPSSRSVALSTEDPANLPFYERYGFTRVSETRVGELCTWALVLPTP